MGALALGLYLLYRRKDVAELVQDVKVRMGVGKGFWEVDVLNLIAGVKSEFPFLREVPDMLVLGVAKTESSLNPNATGGKGEYGLMQIMPMTWTWIMNKYDLSAFNAPEFHYEPRSNLLAGMLVLFDYNQSLGGDWGATVHAYNVGVEGYLNGRRADQYAAKVANNMELA